MRYSDSRQRREEILALREEGRTYREIALRYGFSTGRAKELCHYAKQERQLLLDGHLFAYRLSARSRNGLAGYFGDEAVLFDPGKVVRLGRKGVSKVRNLGPMSVEEISTVLHELGFISDPRAW